MRQGSCPRSHRSQWWTSNLDPCSRATQAIFIICAVLPLGKKTQFSCTYLKKKSFCKNQNVIKSLNYYIKFEYFSMSW